MNMDEDFIYKKIYKIISEKNTFALVMHRNPDGDTVGSAVAMALYLRKNKKNFKFFCKNEVNEVFKNILAPAGILGFDVFNIEKILDYKPECTILFDCADSKQSFIDEEKKEKLPLIVNIDHHITNPKGYDIDLVIPEVSSTCEVMFNFFKKNNIDIDKKMATSLFMGIFTDTGIFTNPATTNLSLLVASDLLLYGARTKDAYKNIVKNYRIKMLKLWGVAMRRLKYSKKNDMVSTYIGLNDFRDCGATSEDAQGISNFLGGSVQAQGIVVYTETEDGFIKASIRSTGNFDALEYANKFGGGGHKKAAGFTAKGKIKNLKNEWKIVKIEEK